MAILSSILAWRISQTKKPGGLQSMDLKKVGKTTRPIRNDLNQIPYDYTVEVTDRFKGLDLIDRLPEELWMDPDTSSKATLWTKAQNEGSLTLPCIIR